jgi:hypothetical protein
MGSVMPRERDTESGEYTESYPLVDFIDALESLGGTAGTREVSDEVGCAYRTAHAKLVELEDEGRVSSRRVGNARLWMLGEE